MKAVLTNLGSVPVPASSTEGDGFVAELLPQEPYTLDNDSVGVLLIGDNPDMREDLFETFKNVADFFARIVTFWRDNERKVGTKQRPVVNVRVQNTMPEHGLRVRQGDDVNLDIEIAAGTTGEANGANYVELRELGLL